MVQDGTHMKRPSLIQIAWLLPLAFFIHLIEEYFGGLTDWFFSVLNFKMSDESFLVINLTALSIMLLFALAFSLGFRSKVILTVLITVLFANGIVHLLASIFTMTYSPGVISGTVLYLPLGRLSYSRVLPGMSEGKKSVAITSGILILVAVHLIARNI